MKFVYYDHGVIVEWLKGNPISAGAINRLKDTVYQPIYSPAHIEELAVPVQRSNLSEGIVFSEMKRISQLTGNIEILPSRRAGLREIRSDGEFGAFLCKENPKRCYERVVDNYMYLNDLAEGGQESFSRGANQGANGRVPGTVNRCDPQQLLREERVKSAILDNYSCIFHAGRAYVGGVLGIKKQSPFVCVDDPEGCISLLKGNHDAVQSMIESVIKCLIRERYFPDPVKKYRSEMHDISHAIYASYCDLYVIEDEKSREKCKAAYEFLGVRTKVLSPAEIIDNFDCF